MQAQDQLLSRARAGGDAAVTSCDLALIFQPRVFVAVSVRTAFFSASEAVIHEPPCQSESTMSQSTRCCSFKGDRMPVAMTKAPSRGTRGQKTPDSFQTAPGSSLVSPLPSWSSPPKVRRCTHEFSSTSGHSRNPGPHQAPSRRTRGRKTPNSFKNGTWFFIGVTVPLVV